MGDAVPLTITVTSSKDISDLSITINTGMEITVDGPQTWEKNISNPTIDRGVAYWSFEIKAGQTLTYNRVLHFPSYEGNFHIIVEVVNTGRIIDAVDSFRVLLTQENGGQIILAGTPIPPHAPNVTMEVYGPGTPAPSHLTNPTYPPEATPVPVFEATSIPIPAQPYPPPPSPSPYP